MYTFPGNFQPSSIPSQFAHIGLFIYHSHSLLQHLVLTYLLARIGGSRWRGLTAPSDVQHNLDGDKWRFTCEPRIRPNVGYRRMHWRRRAKLRALPGRCLSEWR